MGLPADVERDGAPPHQGRATSTVCSRSPETTLELFIHDGRAGLGRRRPTPDGWEGSWHHLAGCLRRGGAAAPRRRAGGRQRRPTRATSTTTPFPVNIGRNAALHGQEHPGELSNAVIDDVRVFARALGADELGRDSPALRREARLWLDFETVEEKGEFCSLGIGGRSYGVVWPDRTVQPELWQLKKSAQPVGVEAVDLAAGRIRVTNHHHFTDLSELETRWRVTADGDGAPGGAPRARACRRPRAPTVEVPFEAPAPGAPGVAAPPGRVLRPAPRHRLGPGRPRGGLGAARPPAGVAPGGRSRLGADSAAPDGARRGPRRRPGPRLRLHVRRGDGHALLAPSRWRRSSSPEGPRANVWRAPLANERDAWGLFRGSSRHPPRGHGQRRRQRLARRRPRPAGAHRRALLGPRRSRRARSWSRCARSPLRRSPPRRVLHGVRAHVRLPRARDRRHRPAPLDRPPRERMPEWLPKVGPADGPRRGDRDAHLVRPGAARDLPGPQDGRPRRRLRERRSRSRTSPTSCPRTTATRPTCAGRRCAARTASACFVSGEELLNVSAQRYSTDNLSRAGYRPQLVPTRTVTLNLDHRVSGVGGTAVSVLTAYQTPPQPYTFTVRLRPFRGEPREVSRQTLR